MSIPNRWHFTPSQLDSFQDCLDSEMLWDKFWGRSDDPPCSPEEFSAQCEKKLIDQINRCPKLPIEAADKGTAVNELVDMLIHNRKPCEIRQDMQVSIPIGQPNIFQVNFNGFFWNFDAGLIRSLAERFRDAISQYRCEASLRTSKGEVVLYGFLDEWYGPKVFDLKTCGDYQFGQYGRKWQRHVYPYTLIESGDTTEVHEFEYTAVKLSKPSEKNPAITGMIYPETYTYDHESSKVALRGICESLIEWIEYRRALITDKRIFGGENPDGYVGTPIDIRQLL